MKWFEYILFLGVGQGIFLSLVITKIARSNKEANRVLAVLMFLVSLILLLRLGLPKIPGEIAIHIWGYADSLAFLFGPLYYFYFKRLLFDEKEFRIPFLHFVPAVLHGLWITLRNILLTPQELSELLQSGKLYPLWTIVIFSLTCSYLYYWVRSLLLVIRFRKKAIQFHSIKVPLGLTIILLAGILTGILLWFFWAIYFLFGVKILFFVNSNTGWIIIPFLTYSVGYYAIAQPEVFRLNKKNGNGAPRVNAGSVDHLLKKLDKIMHEEKPFLDPDLTLSQLATMINTSSNNLSWLINHTFGSNFYDYINKFRIETFINKLQEGQFKNHTLVSLAYDSGFNSKSTFNKVFRKLMHDTPGNYAKKSMRSKHMD